MKCVRCRRTNSICGKPEFTERRTLMQNTPTVNAPINPRALIPSPPNPIQFDALPHHPPHSLSHVIQFPQRLGTQNTDSNTSLASLVRDVERECPGLNLDQAYEELGRRLFRQRLLVTRPRQTAQNTAAGQGIYNNQRRNSPGDLQVQETQHLMPVPQASTAMRRTSSPTRTTPS